MLVCNPLFYFFYFFKLKCKWAAHLTLEQVFALFKNSKYVDERKKNSFSSCNNRTIVVSYMVFDCKNLLKFHGLCTE